MKNTYWTRDRHGMMDKIAALQAQIPVKGPVADAANRPRLERFRAAANGYYEVNNNGRAFKNGPKGFSVRAYYNGRAEERREQSELLEAWMDKIVNRAWEEYMDRIQKEFIDRLEKEFDRK